MSPATYPPAPRRGILGVFAALAVGSSTVEAVMTATRGSGIPIGVSFARNGFIWMLFGALSFAAVFTARRFPLQRARLTSALPAHLATFVAISFAHTLLYTGFIRFILFPDQDARADLLGSLVGNLRGDIFIYAMMIGGYYLYAYATQPRETVAVPAPVAAPPLRRIPLKEDGVVAFIEARDVESIAADGDYVRLNGRFGTRTLRQSLSALEKQLDPAEFARIHRSTIVSLSSIKELQPWFHGEYMAIMASGAKHKVSRTHREALTEALRI